MPRRTHRPADPLGAPSTERLLTLSDGVVAIALTLLVLQLKVPVLSDTGSSHALWRKLTSSSQLGSFVSYIISFYVIAQFWLVHHRVFRLITGHSERLAWWNFAFLFTITVFPFSSALLGAYGSNPVAVIEFSLNLLLASLATVAVTEVARRHGMLDPATTPTMLRSSRARGVATVVVMVAAMAVAPLSPGNAKYVWILLIFTHRAATWWARSGSSSSPESPAGGGDVARAPAAEVGPPAAGGEDTRRDGGAYGLPRAVRPEDPERSE